MSAKGSIRFVGLLILVAALASGTANAMTSPGERADGLRWQGIARVYADMERARAANPPSPQALKADGQRWQGIASLYPQATESLPSPQALRAEAQRWQGLALAYQSEPSPASGSAGFGWTDAGMGAAVIFGLMLLAGATARLIQHRQVPQPQGPKRSVA